MRKSEMVRPEPFGDLTRNYSWPNLATTYQKARICIMCPSASQQTLQVKHNSTNCIWLLEAFQNNMLIQYIEILEWSASTVISMSEYQCEPVSGCTKASARFYLFLLLCLHVITLGRVWLLTKTANICMLWYKISMLSVISIPQI